MFVRRVVFAVGEEEPRKVGDLVDQREPHEGEGQCSQARPPMLKQAVARGREE